MEILGQVVDKIYSLVGGGRRVKYKNFSAGLATEPIAKDTVLLISPRGGTQVAAGFMDAKAPELKPGESMIYSRSSDGGVMSWVITSPDGTAEVSNGFGSIKMASDGSVDINGCRIGIDGSLEAISVKESVTGITLTHHTHASNDTPPTPGG